MSRICSWVVLFMSLIWDICSSYNRISGHHAPVLVDELSVARFCSQPTWTARNLLWACKVLHLPLAYLERWILLLSRLHMLCKHKLYKSRSQGLCFSRLLLLQRAWGRGNIGRPNNLRIIGVYIRFQLVHACIAYVNFTLAVKEYLKTPIFI